MRTKVWYSSRYGFVSSAPIDQPNRTGAGERFATGKETLAEAVDRQEFVWVPPDYRDRMADLYQLSVMQFLSRHRT